MKLLRLMFQSLIGWLQTIIDGKGGWQYLFCFNPLQVGYKHAVLFYQTLRSVSVSIPYRLATNAMLIAAGLTVRRVSIPYRLATNSRVHFYVPNSKECFNPLQVGYKRYFWKYTVNHDIQFQSLIGWLQTFIVVFVHIFHRVFQSLIGWLQTWKNVYATDSEFASFNPLQVGYKQRD